MFPVQNGFVQADQEEAIVNMEYNINNGDLDLSLRVKRVSEALIRDFSAFLG